jgi:redox-sensitive bicupin YhaK (pirin superfamily)
MKKIIHKSDSRGFFDYGWLKTNHTFSFGNYHDPEHINLGMLRVLNDDIVAVGQGFGTHPHNDMEIVSIPLIGALAHKDNTGIEKAIVPNEIQVMSAGTGILHQNTIILKIKKPIFCSFGYFLIKRNTNQDTIKNISTLKKEKINFNLL